MEVRGTSSAEVCERPSEPTLTASGRSGSGMAINLRVIIFFALARSAAGGYESGLKRVESANPCRSTCRTKPELHSFMNNRGGPPLFFVIFSVFFLHRRTYVLSSHVASRRRCARGSTLLTSRLHRHRSASSLSRPPGMAYINPRGLGERRKKESAQRKPGALLLTLECLNGGCIEGEIETESPGGVGAGGGRRLKVARTNKLEMWVHTRSPGAITTPRSTVKATRLNGTTRVTRLSHYFRTR